MRERYPNAGKHFNLVFMAVVLHWKFPTGGGAVLGAAGSAKFFLTARSESSSRREEALISLLFPRKFEPRYLGCYGKWGFSTGC